MSPHLTFDIQVEIIKKLPVKSVLQCRSVCKAWKLLIDNSHFIAGYNDRHDHVVVKYEVGRYGEERQVKYVSFVDDDSFPQQTFALTVPPLLEAKPTIIIDSSHGLLCLTNNFGGTDDSPETHIAVLWNPAIRKSIAVAVPNPIHKPFKSVIGFGVCPDTKDPKLVKITFIDKSCKMESISSIPCQVMIFTLSSGKWTTSSCNNLPPRKSIQFTCIQTNIGQFIYWLAYDNWIAEGGKCRYLIMSFDMNTQEFREIDLPLSLAEINVPALSVFRLRESLAVVVEYLLVSYGTELGKGVCVVWIMEDGDFTELFTINPPNASVSRTIGFRKNGEPIIDKLKAGKYFYETPALAVYDPFSKQIKDLWVSGPKHSFRGCSYTESLLLLDHDDGQIVRCEEVTLGTG